MSDKSEQKPKPLMTFVFDEVTVFTLKAEPNPQAKINPPSENAPLLTVEADEMTEFVVKAISASDLAVQGEKAYRPAEIGEVQGPEGSTMNGVEPSVRLMLLCDDVERRADAPTKLNIVGLVHAINIPAEAAFPIVIDQLTVYLAVTGGRGLTRLQIVGVCADTEEVAFQNPERSIDFGTDPLMVHGLTFRVRAITVHHPGLYLVQVRCNGHVIAHQPLLVR